MTRKNFVDKEMEANFSAHSSQNFALVFIRFLATIQRRITEWIKPYIHQKIFCPPTASITNLEKPTSDATHTNQPWFTYRKLQPLALEKHPVRFKNCNVSDHLMIFQLRCDFIFNRLYLLHCYHYGRFYLYVTLSFRHFFVMWNVYVPLNNI